MDSCVSFLQLWIPSVGSFVKSEGAKRLWGTSLTWDTGMGMDARICGQTAAIKQDLMNIRWTRTLRPIAKVPCATRVAVMEATPANCQTNRSENRAFKSAGSPVQNCQCLFGDITFNDKNFGRSEYFFECRRGLTGVHRLHLCLELGPSISLPCLCWLELQAGSCPAWLLHPSLLQSRQSPQDPFPYSAPVLSSIPSCCAKREQSSTAGNCSSGMVWSTS